MGIRRSIARRWLLARDFPPRKRVKIFFAPKKIRTALSKTMGAGIAYRAKKGMSGTKEQSHVVRKWYASIHNLTHPARAVEHFSVHGLPHGFAPAPEFSDGDGKLPTWSVEYFARLGYAVGQSSVEDLRPGDMDAQMPFSIRNHRNKRLAVASAAFGNFDRLLPVDPQWSESADFFLFTDRKFEDPGEWSLVHANYFHIDRIRRSRFVKTHLTTYLSEFERVMWIDNSVLLCRDPVQLLRDYDVWKYDFATFRHWQRRSLVAEAAACVQLGEDNPRVVGAHLRSIAAHPAFEKQDLFATKVMMINPAAKAARNMSAAWWSYILRGSKLDQLSLPLALYDAAGLNWTVFPEQSIEMSPNFVRLQS